MSAPIPYLRCRVGDYAVVLPMTALLRIWDRSTAADETTERPPIDLRPLLQAADSGNLGVAVAFADADQSGIFIVDDVDGIAMIAADEFLPLPTIFRFANALFAAAGRKALDGRYPLLLRLQPGDLADDAPL